MKKKPLIRSSAPFALLGVSSLVLSSLATAQTGPGKQAYSLEEVIVSATRRSETLQDVPLAISAVTAAELQKGGVFETTDLNRSAPNFQVSSPYGTQQPNFSIRGIGVGTEFNSNAASPVGVYVDEVYQTFRASHGQQLYDLEQIEVVRGPQGTLFGRNTTGGAINFITRKPELGESNGSIAVGYGNYDRKSVEGTYEFSPIQDKFGVRLAGTWVEQDNYVDNELPAGPSTAAAFGWSGLNRNSGIQPGGNENYGVRAQFRFLPTDDIDLTLKVYKAESEGGTEVPIPTGSTKGSDYIDYTNPNFLLSPVFGALAPAGLLPAGYSQNGRGLDTREIESDSAGNALIKADGVVFTGEFEINDDLRFVAVTGYDSGEYHQDPTTDCDATPLALCTIGYNSDYDALNLDFRFDYQSGPLQLTVGAFYGEDSITMDNKPNFFNFLRDVNAINGSPGSYFNPGGGFTTSSARPINLLAADALPTGITATNHSQQDRESWAIYGEGHYELTDTVNLTVGLRYSDDTIEFSEGITTYYDDLGNPRMLSVSNFRHPVTGAYAPYFLADVLNPDGSIAAPAAALNGPGAVAPSGLKSDGSSDAVSGRIILDWNVTDSTMLYGSFSHGYRAGTMNGLAYASANQIYFVDPEEVDAYEIGFKSRLFDDRLQLNGALFYYDYQGQQGQVVDSTATANLISLDGEIRGLELDAKYAATDTLVLSAAVGWLDSEYADDDCPTTPITNIPAQEGSCVVSGTGPVNVGGNPFPYAPEFTANVGFDWDIAEIGAGTLALHGDAAYTGQFYYDSFEEYDEGPLPNLVSGDFSKGEGEYWVYNARLSYDTEKYSIALWGKNLSDEEYYPYGIAIEQLFGNGYRVIAPPRTYGAEFKYNF